MATKKSWKIFGFEVYSCFENSVLTAVKQKCKILNYYRCAEGLLKGYTKGGTFLSKADDI